MSKIRVEAARRESTSVRRKPRKHRAHRRRERESIFSMHIHDWFEPEAVTDHKNHAATKVTDRNGEHAAKPGQEVNSPTCISVENEFGIGTSTEMKPLVPEHRGIRAPVVDFAVMSYADIVGVVGSRGGGLW